MSCSRAWCFELLIFKNLSTYILLGSCQFNRESVFKQSHVSCYCEALLALAEPGSPQPRMLGLIQTSLFLSDQVDSPGGPIQTQTSTVLGTCWRPTWRGATAPTPPGPWTFQMGPALPGTSSPSLASTEWFSSSSWPATSSERMISAWKICITQIWPLNSKRKGSRARWPNAPHWPLATELSCRPASPVWGQSVEIAGPKPNSKGPLKVKTGRPLQGPTFLPGNSFGFIGNIERGVKVLEWGWKSISELWALLADRDVTESQHPISFSDFLALWEEKAGAAAFSHIHSSLEKLVLQGRAWGT